jgi:hypothetical protein
MFEKPGYIYIFCSGRKRQRILLGVSCYTGPWQSGMSKSEAEVLKNYGHKIEMLFS